MLSRVLLLCALAWFIASASPRRVTVASAQPPSVAPLRSAAQMATETRALCSRAQATRKPVLITLGADWCPDCRLMGSLSRQPPLATVLRRFERMDLNVGRFDHHTDLIDGWGIRVIATWVVVTPPASCDTPLVDWTRTGQRTLEPQTGAPVDPSELASWLAQRARPAAAPSP